MTLPCHCGSHIISQAQGPYVSDFLDFGKWSGCLAGRGGAARGPVASPLITVPQFLGEEQKTRGEILVLCC